MNLAGPLAHLCNISMATGIVPNLFKKAIVHPVYKGNKDPRNPSSYRPVAILPAISKLLEVIVPESLLSWFDQIGFLPDSQFGFIPGRSVSMALTVAQTDWLQAKANNEVVAYFTISKCSNL